MTRLTATQQLAHQSWEMSFSDIPDPVRQVARRCLIDTLGVMLAGSRSAVACRALQVARAESSPGAASVVGHRLRLKPGAAAQVNGCAAHALDFDDNCNAGFVHGSAVIVPAVLAMAQQLNVSGADLLTALIAASECQYRLGEALGQTLYHRGWWTTGVLGLAGATVAAAKLLQLSSEQTSHAIGLALAVTGGSKSAFGSDGKSLMAGLAAGRGIHLALLAQAGASGPQHGLEHRYGLPTLTSDGVWFPEQLSEPGWRLLSPGVDIKRIPVCLSSHAAVDAVLHLVQQHRISLAQIQKIVCDVPPLVVANLIYTTPVNLQQAQFSLPFAIAASLLYGELTLTQLAGEVLGSPELQTLMARVTMQSSADWLTPQRSRESPEGALVVLMLEDGRQLQHKVDRALGSASHPLSDQHLETKFRHCSETLLPRETAGKLLAQLRDIENVPDMTSLTLLLEKPEYEL